MTKPKAEDKDDSAGINVLLFTVRVHTAAHSLHSYLIRSKVDQRRRYNTLYMYIRQTETGDALNFNIKMMIRYSDGRKRIDGVDLEPFLDP